MKKALIIREPWIDLILAGAKIWEMRSRPTYVRGTIGLIRKGTNLIVGTADLTDSLPALSRETYMRHGDRHAIPEAMLEEVLANGWVFPWVLSKVHPLAEPLAVQRKSGPVTFVNIEAEAIAPTAAAASKLPADEGECLTSRPVANDVASALSSAGDAPIFAFRPEAAQAYGRPLPDGRFKVLAGSTAMKHGRPNKKRDDEDRRHLLRDGVLAPDADSRLYRFSCDYVFSSASKAAGVVKDGNASGPMLWECVGSGETLKSNLART